MYGMTWESGPSQMPPTDNDEVDVPAAMMQFDHKGSGASAIQLIHAASTAGAAGHGQRSVKSATSAVGNVANSNDVAMPLSLILNELLTNAVKHGIKDPGVQTIRVGLTETNDVLELYVEDDGDGFELDTARKSSSGLQLVLGLARQLNGTLQVTQMPSSRASLRFAPGITS